MLWWNEIRHSDAFITFQNTSRLFLPSQALKVAETSGVGYKLSTDPSWRTYIFSLQTYVNLNKYDNSLYANINDLTAE